MATLAELPLLRELSILNMDLSGEEYWIILGKLASLERLSLNLIRPKVTDANISHLSGLYSLKVLYILSVLKDKNYVVAMDVTDEGLMHLSKLQALERLSLIGAKVTDKGLRQLEGLKFLRSIDFGRGNKITEQGLQRLKKKLPALQWYL